MHNNDIDYTPQNCPLSHDSVKLEIAKLHKKAQKLSVLCTMTADRGLDKTVESNYRTPVCTITFYTQPGWMFDRTVHGESKCNLLYSR